MPVARRLRPIAGVAALLVAALVPAPAAGAASPAASVSCGVAVPGALEARAMPGATVAEPSAPAGGADLLAGHQVAAQSAAGSVVVRTYVHVIANGWKRSQGMLSPAEVRAQMRVLNRSFAGTTSPDAANTSFRFQLVGTTYTVKPAWSQMLPDSAAEWEAKRTLRRGDERTLNVYLSGLGGGLLGYAYYPEFNNPEPWRDGVVILNESIPGGSLAPYNQGDTLPHEVGHWLGLAHTFDGGCSPTNDRVRDTPAQRTPTTGCPEHKDTCPRMPGVDPVENFMDYSADSCMNAFTRGQAARMDAVWQVFRAR